MQKENEPILTNLLWLLGFNIGKERPSDVGKNVAHPLTRYLFTENAFHSFHEFLQRLPGKMAIMNDALFYCKMKLAYPMVGFCCKIYWDIPLPI